MITAIVVSLVVVIGAVLLFGPIGLVIALIGTVCCGWIFSKGDEEKDKAHAKQMDEDLKGFFSWWLKK